MLYVEVKHLDAREGHQSDGGAVGEATLIEIFAHATAGIATHHRLAAVGIEDAHGEVGSTAHLAVAYQHQSIAAYALVAVTKTNCYFGGVGNRLLHRINVDVVIAATVHFCESYHIFFFRGS